MEILNKIRNFLRPVEKYRVVKKVSICIVTLKNEENFTLQMRENYSWIDIKTFSSLEECISFRELHEKFINNQNETIIKI